MTKDLSPDEAATVTRFGLDKPEPFDLDAVAPWPSEKDATADGVIAHLSAVTVFYSTAVWAFLRSERISNDRGDTVRAKEMTRRYVECLDRYVGAAQSAHLLVMVQADNTELADRLAKELVSGTEDGGWFGEISWDWLEARGVDPQPIQGAAVAWSDSEVR